MNKLSLKYIISLLMMLILSCVVIFVIRYFNKIDVKLYYKSNGEYTLYNLNAIQKYKINKYINNEKFDILDTNSMYKCTTNGDYKLIFDGNELFFDGQEFCVAIIKKENNETGQVIIDDELRNYIYEIVNTKGEE